MKKKKKSVWKKYWNGLGPHRIKYFIFLRRLSLMLSNHVFWGKVFNTHLILKCLSFMTVSLLNSLCSWLRPYPTSQRFCRRGSASWTASCRLWSHYIGPSRSQAVRFYWENWPTPAMSLMPHCLPVLHLCCMHSLLHMRTSSCSSTPAELDRWSLQHDLKKQKNNTVWQKGFIMFLLLLL